MFKVYQSLSALVLGLIVCVKGVNKPPYFLPNHDFNAFSLPENFQIGTSVYKLKGKKNNSSLKRTYSKSL